MYSVFHDLFIDLISPPFVSLWSSKALRGGCPFTDTIACWQCTELGSWLSPEPSTMTTASISSRRNIEIIPASTSNRWLVGFFWNLLWILISSGWLVGVPTLLKQCAVWDQGRDYDNEVYFKDVEESSNIGRCGSFSINVDDGPGNVESHAQDCQGKKYCEPELLPQGYLQSFQHIQR